MRRIYCLIIVFCIFIIIACNNNESKGTYTGIKHTSESNLSNTELKIDTITLNAEGISMEGQFIVRKNQLLFCDEVFALVQIYDQKGEKIARKLGKGKGPSDLPNLYRATVSRDESNDLVVLDKSWNLYCIDTNYVRIGSSFLDFEQRQKYKDLLNHPDFENPGIYEVEYYGADICSKNGQVLLPITTEHPKLNSLANNCETYYKDVYMFALFDLQTGKLKRMLGKRPPIYLNYHYLPNLNYFKTAWVDDYIYYSSEIDPKIYVMDLDGNLLKSFGLKGRDLNTNYLPTRSLEDSESNFLTHREIFGYYNYLDYENGFFFRGYQKGGEETTDGLQIYKKETLIADFDVPVGTYYIGFIKGYHYLFLGSDEENESFTLGKFKLK